MVSGLTMRRNITPVFLSDWLAKHVTGDDMKMKPVLQNYPYDFKPD